MHVRFKEVITVPHGGVISEACPVQLFLRCGDCVFSGTAVDILVHIVKTLQVFNRNCFVVTI